MVLTALTIAVSKGTDSGIEDEVAPATTHFLRPPDDRPGPGIWRAKERVVVVIEPERQTVGVR